MSDYRYQIPNEIARVETVGAARPERHTRLRAVAETLNRRGLLEAKVAIANEALFAVTEILWDVDADGSYANVDVDGRILVALPWGRNGYKAWGLRVTEMRALNHVLRHRSHGGSNPLFVFDGEARCWLVGRGYTKRTAMAYLRTMPVTLAEYRAAWRAQRSTWAGTNLGND